jgi:hypothetical protein
MFLLVDVQSMIVKVLKSRSIAVGVALTSILDDFFVPSRIAASAESNRSESP